MLGDQGYKSLRHDPDKGDRLPGTLTGSSDLGGDAWVHSSVKCTRSPEGTVWERWTLPASSCGEWRKQVGGQEAFWKRAPPKREDLAATGEKSIMEQGKPVGKDRNARGMRRLPPSPSGIF